MYLEHQLDASIKSLLAHIQRRICQDSTYFGIPTIKPPTDFWIFQELVFELKPDLIIEIGNYRGGSALAFAHMLDQIGKGSVIAIDIDQTHIAPLAKAHSRIEFIEGDAASVAPAVRAKIPAGARVLIVEDSSHTYDNTLAVLRAYADFVTPGSYFVVEDSLCHHGIDEGPSPGPYEALDTFLAENDRFESDRSREAFLMSWNLKGYLKRIK
jgi:cephalosporin hydroxylase